MMGAHYTYSRLCFKRDVIEPLGRDDEFEMETPVGVFRMAKREFYDVFNNVVKTRSYQEKGIYHYPKVPAKAEQFLIRPGDI
jgi:hypothetical protein